MFGMQFRVWVNVASVFPLFHATDDVLSYVKSIIWLGGVDVNVDGLLRRSL